MAGARNDFTYKGYGCPHTEMWSRRAAFEEARPDLNHFMKMDAPHYASSKTRIAYAEWEAALEALASRETTCTPDKLAEFANAPEVSGELS